MPELVKVCADKGNEMLAHLYARSVEVEAFAQASEDDRQRMAEVVLADVGYEPSDDDQGDAMEVDEKLEDGAEEEEEEKNEEEEEDEEEEEEEGNEDEEDDVDEEGEGKVEGKAERKYHPMEARPAPPYQRVDVVTHSLAHRGLRRFVEESGSFATALLERVEDKVVHSTC